MPVTTSPETIEGLDAESLIVSVLEESEPSTVCLTCSFQAEDMIVLDLLRKRLPQLPVLFLETGYHFSETYQFRDRMTAEWRLNLVNALRTGDSLSGGSGQVLPTSQGRAFDGVARTIRHLVHWLASRTISDTKKSQKDRTAPVAERENCIESQPARRLDLGAGLGIHRQTQPKLSPAVRPGLCEHRLRALHGDSRRPGESAIGALERQETRVRNPYFLGEN